MQSVRPPRQGSASAIDVPTTGSFPAPPPPATAAIATACTYAPPADDAAVAGLRETTEKCRSVRSEGNTAIRDLPLMCAGYLGVCDGP